MIGVAERELRVDASSVGNPGAVAVTAGNLVTMSVKVSAMGAIQEVTEVLSVVPLGEVDELKVKRAGLTGVMEITVGGSSFNSRASRAT
jgi:hypothetical protein